MLPAIFARAWALRFCDLSFADGVDAEYLLSSLIAVSLKSVNVLNIVVDTGQTLTLYQRMCFPKASSLKSASPVLCVVEGFFYE